jgi:hypothetical protein
VVGVFLGGAAPPPPGLACAVPSPQAILLIIRYPAVNR